MNMVLVKKIKNHYKNIIQNYLNNISNELIRYDKFWNLDSEIIED